MDLTITTAHLPERDRLAYWRDEAAKWHLAHDIELIDQDAPFQAELNISIVGDVIIGDANLSGVVGHRTAQHIAADRRDHFVLILPANKFTVTQGGIECVIDETAMVLLDSTHPLHFSLESGKAGSFVTIPRHCLVNRLADADVTGPRVVSLDRGVGLLVRSFLQALPEVAESCPGTEVRRALAEQLISLLALAYRASVEDGESAKQTLSQVRFQAINEFIGMHLHDADLSPDHLAQALGISRSYLYKLFVEYGFSFQEHLRTRRLTQIAAELRKPCLNKLSITEVALRCGFNNASHFSRCFTQQYGESPRAYRTRMLKTGS